MKKIEVHYAYGNLREDYMTISFEVDEQFTPEEIREFIRKEIINGLEFDYREITEDKKAAQTFKFGG